ncbi:MAG TPA: hypothetical protein VIC87_08670, partial [Vicinamibacteria bacterium]
RGRVMFPRLDPERLVVGAGLLAFGVLGGLAQLGRVDLLLTLRTWWPAALVLWGLAELYQTYTHRGRRTDRRNP